MVGGKGGDGGAAHREGHGGDTHMDMGWTCDRLRGRRRAGGVVGHRSEYTARVMICATVELATLGLQMLFGVGKCYFVTQHTCLLLHVWLGQFLCNWLTVRLH